jgi:hypothetical protein
MISAFNLRLVGCSLGGTIMRRASVLITVAALVLAGLVVAGHQGSGAAVQSGTPAASSPAASPAAAADPEATIAALEATVAAQAATIAAQAEQVAALEARVEALAAGAAPTATPALGARTYAVGEVVNVPLELVVQTAEQGEGRSAELTVDSVEVVTTIDQSHIGATAPPLVPEGVFVLVRFTVTNLGNQNANTFYYPSFVLLWGEREYPPAHYGNVVPGTDSVFRPAFPGHAALAFDVPPTATGLVLRIGEDVYVDLGI